MRDPAGFRARYDVTLRMDSLANGAFVDEQMWAETTLVTAYERTQRFDPLLVLKHVPAAPGRYSLLVTLEDLQSGEKASRSQSVTVVDPSGTLPAIGRVMLQSKRVEGRFLPEIAFHIPFDAESLRCAVDVYNVPPNSQLSADLRILKFHADTSSALPPFTYSLMGLPIGYGLVDFEKADTVYTRSYLAAATRRLQTVAFRIPQLEEGLFRFDVQVRAPKEVGGDTALVTTRFYSLKGSGFPRPATIREMIEAAVYIATDKEYRALIAATHPEDQRAKFEEFWLNLVKEKSLASAMIRRYYTRVEEANRLFTTVREGWRTDRGMLYIVLGPPGNVTNQLDTQIWFYDFPGGVQYNTYTFKRVIRQGEGVSVEEYVLYRRTYYEVFWDRMVAKWRSGEGL